MAKPILHFKRDTLFVSANGKLAIPASDFVSTGNEKNVKIRIWNIVAKADGTIGRGKYDETRDFKVDFPDFVPVAADVGINFLNMVAWKTDEPPTAEEPFFSQHTVVLDVRG